MVFHDFKLNYDDKKESTKESKDNLINQVLFSKNLDCRKKDKSKGVLF